ncbi:MAG TPA: hypothetical protein PK272_07320 [Methanoregulaceae archaeon]|nr:hypothetical protein [Methanoregulaceae archaeon]
MDLKDYLLDTATQVDKLIYRYFGETCGELGEASSHLLLAGGKRLRPVMLILSADAVRKGSSIDLMPAAVMILVVLGAAFAAEQRRHGGPFSE